MARTPAADADRANPARVYEYLLGGLDWLAADKTLAEELMDPVKGYPGLRARARENRAFIAGSVRWAAAMPGTGQFLDLGCGLPAVPAVHEIARAVIPRAAVAYVDRDPAVARHVRAACGGARPGLSVTVADIADPAAVLADPGLRGVIDLGRPACVIFGAVLDGMDADQARSAVAGFAGALAPGSAVIISCFSYGDEDLARRMAAMFSPASPYRNHGRETVESFFAAGGLRLLHGRVMDVSCWPVCPADGGGRDAVVLGGIGIRDLARGSPDDAQARPPGSAARRAGPARRPGLPERDPGGMGRGPGGGQGGLVSCRVPQRGRDRGVAAPQDDHLVDEVRVACLLQ